MALTRVSLTTVTNIADACSKITITDITGNYNATSNPLGYSLPGGITYANITSIVINLYYPSVTTPIKYTFTMASGIPTALTVTDLNGVVYDIFADIATLYVLGVFNLTGTDAFTLPTITDGIINTDFTISGTSPEAFSYTTSNWELSSCSVNCCIENMYKNLDMCCDCSESAMDRIKDAELFLCGAMMAIEIGQNEKAQCLLDKATALCDGNCTDC